MRLIILAFLLALPVFVLSQQSAWDSLVVNRLDAAITARFGPEENFPPGGSVWMEVIATDDRAISKTVFTLTAWQQEANLEPIYKRISGLPKGKTRIFIDGKPGKMIIKIHIKI